MKSSLNIASGTHAIVQNTITYLFLGRKFDYHLKWEVQCFFDKIDLVVNEQINDKIVIYWIIREAGWWYMDDRNETPVQLWGLLCLKIDAGHRKLIDDLWINELKLPWCSWMFF